MTSCCWLISAHSNHKKNRRLRSTVPTPQLCTTFPAPSSVCEASTSSSFSSLSLITPTPFYKSYLNTWDPAHRISWIRYAVQSFLLFQSHLLDKNGVILATLEYDAFLQVYAVCFVAAHFATSERFLVRSTSYYFCVVRSTRFESLPWTSKNIFFPEENYR